MDAHELAEKLRNTQPKTVEVFEEVVKWCSDNEDNLNISDSDQKYLYTMATKYLMQIKIGRWNDDDAKMIIKFFAKSYAREYGIEEKITIEILQLPEYQERFKDLSNARCINMGDGNSCVVYSGNVVDNLKSNDTVRFLRGLQTVFHEVVHSRQYNDLYAKAKESDYDGDMYKMALETIVHRVSPQFYQKNYTSQVREYQAEYLGLEEALEKLRLYYKPEIMQDFTEEEKKEFLNEMLQIDGKGKYGDGDSIKFSGKDVNAVAFVDYVTEHYVAGRPVIIDEMPILQRAYNKDGNKKDIIQLLQDRQALIDNGESNDKTDDLYETIANYRNYEKGELRGELEALDRYVVTTGIDDEFAFQLIEQRLRRINLTEQEITKYMDDTRKQVEITRMETETKTLEEEEPEIAPREEESIRDEIGDEFVPKTEGQEQEEAQVETMWQNRFQSWDRNSVNLPNSAKRKEEAVRVMQDIERERREQNREQQMKDNEQEQMQR